MKDSINKLRILAKGVLKRGESYKRSAITPADNWAVIIIVSFTIFFFFMIMGVYFYMQIKDDKMFKIEQQRSLSEVKINYVSLKKAVDEIDNREKATIEIKNEGVRFADPSL